MIRWFVILAEPAIQIHDAAARPFIDAALLSYEVLAGIGTTRASVNGEIPGVTLRLVNDNAESMSIYRNPPLGAGAIEYGRRGNETVELSRGVVTSLVCAADASLEISA
jgi:hypothetical protein